MKANPVLVTGSHRSGKSWLSQCLMVSNQMFLINEPFSNYRGATHQSELIRSLRHTYTYIGQANEAEFEEDVAALLHYPTYCRRLAKDRGAGVHDSLKCFVKLILGSMSSDRAPLIDDPFLVFSADWMHRRFGAQVIIMIRNPGAFVAACECAGYGFDFENLLRQRHLIQDKLGGFIQEIEAMSSRKDASRIAQNALLWKLIYHCVYNYSQQYPNWTFLRFEDLALNPAEHVESIYKKYALKLDRHGLQRLEKHFSKPEKAKGKDALCNSRQLRYPIQEARDFHKNVLNDKELHLVQCITNSVAAHFYKESEWA